MRKTLFLVLVFLFMATPCFATIVEVRGSSIDSSGFSYTPVTKTDTEIGLSTETDTEVWVPANGKKIVLLGVKFNANVATTLLVESGSTAIVPVTQCAASGQIVVGNGTPIWKGDANATLTYTTNVNSGHSILMWGYETEN